MRKTNMRRILIVSLILMMLVGIMSIGIMAAEGDAVAEVNGTKYATLQDAIDAAKAGDNTITLLRDCEETVTIKQVADVNIVINGNGKTFSGTIKIDGNNRPDGAETLTIESVKFNKTDATNYAYFIDAEKNAADKNSEAHNVTISDCTFESTNWHYAIGARNPQNFVVKRCTATRVYYFIYIPQGGNGLKVENCEVTNATYGIGAQKCTGVYVKDYTYTGMAAGFYGRATSNVCKTVLENVDITTTLSGQFPVTLWKNDDGGTSATYTIYLKGENTFNNVVATPDNNKTWFAPQIETNSPYEIVEVVAQIGEDQYFGTLQGAINVANGATITLIKDITEDVAVSGNVVITDAKNSGTFTLADVSATLTIDTTATVVSGVADHRVVYANGVYSVVEEAPIPKIDSVVVNGSYIHNGSEQTADITVKAGDVVLTPDDYILTGNKATDVGTYTITVTGTGNYQGTVTVEWTIAKALVRAYAANNPKCKYFDNIADALAYTATFNDYGPVYVLDDITVTETIVFNDPVANTIELQGIPTGGKYPTITCTEDAVPFIKMEAGRLSIKNLVIKTVGDAFLVTGGQLNLQSAGNGQTLEVISQNGSCLVVEGGSAGVLGATDLKSESGSAIQGSENGTGEVTIGQWSNYSSAPSVTAPEGKPAIGGLDSEDVSIQVGSFSSDVSDFCDEGYAMTQKPDGSWVAAKAVAKNNAADKIYTTLQEAINAAQAGDIITFLADITEDVTISKKLTIDGANFKYTNGTMTVNAGLTVTIQNVNFVNAGIDKSAKSTTGTYTIKNCTFDGEGKYDYSFRFKGANEVVIEECTVTNYLYSFLYVTSGTNSVSVKNVTVENCPSYAIYFASGVNTATIEGLTVKNSNNGFVINNTANRAFTIKDCKMENVRTAINHANGTNTITCTVLGENNFGTAATSQYAKYVLAATDATDATLIAPEGFNVTTNVEGYVVKYIEGTYKLVEATAQVGNNYYETLQEAINAAQDGETVVLLKDISLDTTNLMTNSDGYSVLLNIADKAITVDLNGKVIAVEVKEGDFASAKSGILLGVFAVDTNGRLTLKDSVGTGAVNVTGGANAYVYCLAIAYEGLLTIESGNYYVDYLREGRGMIYGNVGDSETGTGPNGNKGVNISGGNFTLGNVGTLANKSPWILATADNNSGKYIYVTGGTFNDDIAHQYWVFEVVVPYTSALKSNGDGTWTVADAVAYVKGYQYATFYTVIGYATFEEAFNAAIANAPKATEKGMVTTIVLLADTDYSFTLSEKITLDLNGYNYTGTVTLNVGGELTAPEGHDVTTDVDGYKVIYEDGAYKLDLITFDTILTNIRFGETLSLIFAVPTDGVCDQHNAVITIGEGDDQIKVTVPFGAEWKKYSIDGDEHYVIEYAGLAAKQMTDQVAIEFFLEDVSENIGTKTTSVCTYALSALEESDNDAFKTVVVDMLNYGAAAQIYFAKQENPEIDVTTLDLANAKLTDAEKALATKSYADCENPAHNHSRKGGETINLFFMATSVRFDDSISLVFKFDLRGYEINNMKAVFTYTDHNGVKHTIGDKEDGSDKIEFVPVENEEGIYVVELDTLVIADAHQTVTCTISEVEGGSTYIADSIAGYVARRVESNKLAENDPNRATDDAVALYKAFMMFADSAYAYKHPQQ